VRRRKRWHEKNSGTDKCSRRIVKEKERKKKNPKTTKGVFQIALREGVEKYNNNNSIIGNKW
jgi:hypothetical protein